MTLPNLNTVVLITHDEKVIHFCKHALEDLFSLQIFNSIKSYPFSTNIFAKVVIIDEILYATCSDNIILEITRRSKIIFIARNKAITNTIKLQDSEKLSIPFPIDLDLFRKLVKSILDNFHFDMQSINCTFISNNHSSADISYFKNLLGKSKIILSIKHQLAEVAKTEIPVLLLGESGTGKTFVAKMIHDNSTRKSKDFVAVEMPSISYSLAESELFGTASGAYTGAIKRAGRFSKANGGTLFLDEIADIPITIQSKLLRVIETGNYFSVGSDIEHNVNVRFICATNANVLKMLSEKKFREDLYYRIAGYVITMPPLRNRKEDILEIVKSFLSNENKILTTNATEKILEYDWPGNIRQLKSCIKRACVLSNNKDNILPENIVF